MSTLRRKSGYAIALFALGVLMVVAMLVHAYIRAGAMEPGMQLRARTVRELGLSDLCLFTEARYTRHPSAADLHTAFQDHPFSLEHFPSGSFISPPEMVGSSYPAAVKGKANGPF